MDWPAKARSMAKGSPSPDLIFPMSPPDSYSFPRPADTGVARTPGALVTRARIQSARGSAAMSPEAQVAVQEATERKYSAHPSHDPFAPIMYGRRGPPPPTTPGLSTRTTTGNPTRGARTQQDSPFKGLADSHYRPQASHHSHRPSALANGYSTKSDNDKGKGKAVYTHAGGTHASHGGGDAYKAHTPKKVHKFYVNDDDDDDDDDDEDYTSDDMDKLNEKMGGLSTRYWSEGSRGTTSRGHQQYWGALMDVPKRSPQPAHSQTRQRPSLPVQPEQHVEQHVKQHVKQQRVHSSRHASGSKKVRSSRTRPHQVHHSPVSPGHAAPTSGTHRLHALAYPYSPDDRFPHPSASEGRSAPIPVPGYMPQESPSIARSFRETDAPAYQEYMKRVGLM